MHRRFRAESALAHPGRFRILLSNSHTPCVVPPRAWSTSPPICLTRFRSLLCQLLHPIFPPTAWSVVCSQILRSEARKFVRLRKVVILTREDLSAAADLDYLMRECERIVT